MSDAIERPAGGRKGAFKRLLPLAVLVAGFVAFFAFDLDRFVSFQVLQDNRAELTAFVADNRLLAAILYMLAYLLMVAFSLPAATLVSILGGFLFGTALGTFLVVVGATAGATALFLIARSTLGAFLRERSGSAIRRMEEGFSKNAFSYLLILRLIPLFPFFLVNIVPALLGVKLRDYVLATALGIIPGVLVFVSVGAGAGAILDQGSVPGLEAFLEIEIILPLVGLLVLAMLPIVYKRFRKSQ